jgi:ABC-type Fe3+ transport system substrate-binding protein
MNLQRVLLLAAFALILGVPFAMRPRAEADPESRSAPVLIIITPHVPQIHREFGAAFDRWHKANYGSRVRIDWRYAGTTEILKQLEAQYTAALKAGKFDLSDPANPACAPGLIGYDLMFGGGTYDHGRVKSGVNHSIPDPSAKHGVRIVKVPMSAPAGFSQAQLDAWFGENIIGIQPLYDPEQFWIGTALSSFGIVYNRDMLKARGLPEPRSFKDLTDPRYMGSVALADPRQSGSVATALDSILNNFGWDEGWKILREMCANTRYYTSSSPKTPIDVSAGEAAAGLAIDFYGRGQAQAVMREGETPETSRVGYSDPAGSVYIDADPISILRGGPNPELAKRFVEFCLTEEGQALWQFHIVGSPMGGSNPIGSNGEPMGPKQYELRRLPIRRVMFEKYMPHFIDKVDPYAIASKMPVKGWRPALGVMMGAFSIDVAHEQRDAWRELNAARATPSFPAEILVEMERLFYAWPVTTSLDGKPLEFTPQNLRAIRDVWRNPDLAARCKIDYTRFFQSNYHSVVKLARTAQKQ